MDRMAVRHCGCIEDIYDPRDFKKVYRYSAIPQVDVDTYNRCHSKCLIKYVDHVYDQGKLKSCTANALCAAYGLDLKKQEQNLPGAYSYFNPSRLFLYYNTKDYEGTTQYDAGASIRDTIKALNRTGVCKEVLWPYNIKEFKEKPPKYAYDGAVGNNLCKYERLTHDVDQFRACLNDDCPFVFGFKVYPSFFTISRNGNMPLPTETEKEIGPKSRHAVMAVGYSDERKCIIVLNSWGQGWGSYGYFYMPYDFIKDPGMCSDFWKISFACQRGKPLPAGTVMWEDGIIGKSNGYTRYNGNRGRSSHSRSSTPANDYTRRHESLGGGIGNDLYLNGGGAITRASHNSKTLPSSYSNQSEFLGESGEFNRSSRRRMDTRIYSDLLDTYTQRKTSPSLFSGYNRARIGETGSGHCVKPTSTYNWRTGNYYDSQ